MNKVKRRAMSALLVAVLVLGGIGVYIVRYIEHGAEWATFAANSSVYTSGVLSTGTLTDRTGRKFPVGCDKCHGVVTMYNAVPTWMADKPEALEHAAFWLLDCTCAENPFAILEAFRQSSAAPFPVTRGLYFRGVE